MLELLFTSIRVEIMYCFLADREGQFVAQTLVNYSIAFQWHLIYLRYLLHVNSSPSSVGQKTIQLAVQSKLQQENEKRLQEMEDSMKKMKSDSRKTNNPAK